MKMFPGWSRALALALVGSMLPLISFGADFDIPLSELAKVKKKTPAKSPVSNKHRKSRKNGEDKEQPAVEETAAVKEPAAAGDTVSPSKAVEEAGRIVLDEQRLAPNAEKERNARSEASPVPAPKAAAAAPAAVSLPPAPSLKPPMPAPAAVVQPLVAQQAPVTPPAGNATIIHDPNSYIVTGKRTVILAVVSSPGEIRSVLCHFRAAADSPDASVPMVKVPGTQFTYSAVIPALAPGATVLRYTFSAIDARDRVARSREYEVKVVNLPVVPGWQLDNFQDKLRIGLENSNKPLEGFKDPGLSK